MERESFVFYQSFVAWIESLPTDEEKLKAYQYITRYWVYWELPQEKWWAAYGIFAMAKPQIDANNKKYAYWCKGWRPPKNWDNSQKPKVSNSETYGYETSKPNDNVNDNVNVNVNENEKGLQGETLDANASRWTVEEKRAVGKNLGMKLSELWLEPELIELAETYDKCKKGKKLSKFQDAQLKIRVNKLRRCWFNTVEWMRQVLENSIAGSYEWIFELKQNPTPTKPRVSWNLFH